MLQYTVDSENEGRTVKSIALHELKLSAGALSGLKFKNAIFLDGMPVHVDVKVRAGQVLSVETGDEQFFISDSTLVKTVYEDDDYVVIDKPAGLPTMASSKKDDDTLEKLFLQACGKSDSALFRPVNRLDKGTGGLMVTAKNAHAQQLLQKELHSAAFEREYLALINSTMPACRGTISLPIGRIEGSVKRKITPDGKPCVTHYRVLKENPGQSLIYLKLETGRTHQIRVHLSSLGCPIVGDYLYGTADDSFSNCFALHSFRVKFVNPLTGKHIQCISLPEWSDNFKPDLLHLLCDDR